MKNRRQETRPSQEVSKASWQFSRSSMQIPKILRQLGSLFKKKRERESAHQLEATSASPTPQPRWLPPTLSWSLAVPSAHSCPITRPCFSIKQRSEEPRGLWTPAARGSYWAIEGNSREPLLRKPAQSLRAHNTAQAKHACSPAFRFPFLNLNCPRRGSGWRQLW